MRGAIVLLMCVGGWVFGQPVDSQPAFEVATIKPSPPPGTGPRPVGAFGGPGRGDPSRVNFQFLSLANLVTLAYGVNLYQLTAPSWLDTERFDITAKIPDGATPDQVPSMLQNLLAERFHLAVHRDKKEGTVYELVVGKNGPKLKESAEEPAPKEGLPPSPPRPPGPPKLDANGFPVLPAGRGPGMMMMNGNATMRFPQASMEMFARMLSNQVWAPVTDATGLKGKYDVSLHFAAAGMGFMGAPLPPLPPPPPGVPVASTPGDDAGPTLFGAIQEQLGLKLEQKKGMIDIIVVDHIDKVPTEN